MNEPLRNRSETRVAAIPIAPLKRIPKLPKESPLKGVPPAQPNMSHHGAEPRAPDTPKKGSQTPTEPRKRKEQERVDKWMKMMKVARRDQGGNIQEWVWRSDGQGAKVSEYDPSGL